jgi:hypothetical protein
VQERYCPSQQNHLWEDAMAIAKKKVVKKKAVAKKKKPAKKKAPAKKATKRRR